MAEIDVQADPRSLRAWLSLIAETSGGGDANNANALNIVFERALVQLPYNYKLWSMYLTARMEQVEQLHPTHGAVAAVCKVFERAVAVIPMMPRLWVMYGDFVLNRVCRLDTALAVFQRSLGVLPPAQHNKIWTEGLKPLASHVACPAVLSTFLFRQYLNLKNDLRAHYSYLEQLLTDPSTAEAGLEVSLQLASRFPNALATAECWERLLPHLERALGLPSVPLLTEGVRLVSAGVSMCPEHTASLLKMLVFLAARVGDYVAARDALVRMEQLTATASECHEVLVLRHAFESNCLELLVSEPTSERFKHLYGEELHGADPTQAALTRCEQLVQDYSKTINVAAIRAAPKDVSLWMLKFQLLANDQRLLSRAFKDATQEMGSGASWLLYMSYFIALEEAGLPAHEHRLVQEALLSNISDDDALIHAMLAKLGDVKGFPLLEKIIQQHTSGAGPSSGGSVGGGVGAGCVAVCAELMTSITLTRKGFLPALLLLSSHVADGIISVAGSLRCLRRLTAHQLEQISQDISEQSAAASFPSSSAAAEATSIVDCYTALFHQTKTTNLGLLVWLELLGYLTRVVAVVPFSAQVLETWRQMIEGTQEELTPVVAHHPHRQFSMATAKQDWEVACGNDLAAGASVHTAVLKILAQLQSSLSNRLVVSTDVHRACLVATLKKLPLVSTYELLAPRWGPAISTTNLLEVCNSVIRIVMLLAQVPVTDEYHRFIRDALSSAMKLLFNFGALVIRGMEGTHVAARARAVFQLLAKYTIILPPAPPPQPVEGEDGAPAAAAEGGDEQAPAAKKWKPRRYIPPHESAVADFWETWKQFEAKHGSKDTFEEVIKLRNTLAKKRSGNPIQTGPVMRPSSAAPQQKQQQQQQRQ